MFARTFRLNAPEAIIEIRSESQTLSGFIAEFIPHAAKEQGHHTQGAEPIQQPNNYPEQTNLVLSFGPCVKAIGVQIFHSPGDNRGEQIIRHIAHANGVEVRTSLHTRFRHGE